MTKNQKKALKRASIERAVALGTEYAALRAVAGPSAQTYELLCRIDSLAGWWVGGRLVLPARVERAMRGRA
jgi:hypothetical protein